MLVKRTDVVCVTSDMLHAVEKSAIVESNCNVNIAHGEHTRLDFCCQTYIINLKHGHDIFRCLSLSLCVSRFAAVHLGFRLMIVDRHFTQRCHIRYFLFPNAG
jgi:hypothetical protein